jgi:hypothetical protein
VTTEPAFQARRSRATRVDIQYRVVVAEDVYAYRATIIRMLGEPGLACVTVGDGVDGMD